MPPVPPAHRPTTATLALAPPASPDTPLSAKHLRFLTLLAAHPTHPDQALSPAALERLPAPCRTALYRLRHADALRLVPVEDRPLLAAYYAAGYRPHRDHTTFALEVDLHHATQLLNADSRAGFLALVRLRPHLSDLHSMVVLEELLTRPDLRSPDKIRLEALRLLLTLKGHLVEENQQVVQATQIVIHTGQSPDSGEREQLNTGDKVVEIDLSS